MRRRHRLAQRMRRHHSRATTLLSRACRRGPLALPSRQALTPTMWRRHRRGLRQLPSWSRRSGPASSARCGSTTGGEWYTLLWHIWGTCLVGVRRPRLRRRRLRCCRLRRPFLRRHCLRCCRLRRPITHPLLPPRAMQVMIIVFLQLCVTVGVAATFMFVQPLRVSLLEGWRRWVGGGIIGGQCSAARPHLPHRHRCLSPLKFVWLLPTLLQDYVRPGGPGQWVFIVAWILSLVRGGSHATHSGPGGRLACWAPALGCVWHCCLALAHV